MPSVLRTHVALALLAAASAIACSKRHPFMWIDAITLPGEQETREYRISVGDVLSIRVWNQESMSASNLRVREDGNVSIPFLQDVEVVGMTPRELASRLAIKLKTYVVTPVVTVVVEESRPLRVSVLGEVTRPGVYDLDRHAGVLHALATAGGLTQLARQDRIFVLRQGYWADRSADPVRIRFRYEELAAGVGKAAAFRLRTGDIVVVE